MKNIIVCLALLLLSPPVLAELEVITLKHRSAEEIMTVIRPLLGEEDAVSGTGYQLILRTSPRNLAQIRKLLESIDTAPRRLKISVIQDVDSETAAQLTGISGDVAVGDSVRIIAGGKGDSGLNVELKEGQSRLRANVVSTRSLEGDHKVQQMQVLEGNRALVQTGQSMAIPQRQVIRNQWGTQVIDSTEYREVGSGFYVLPRVNGDRVTVEISTRNDSPASGTGRYPGVNIQQASSTVSGRLGEWLAVGGLEQQKSSDGSTLSTRSISQVREQRNVLIRVEEVK